MGESLTRGQASIIAFLLDRATQSNWGELRDAVLDAGWSVNEVVQATKQLCHIAGINNILDADDF